MNRSIQSMHPLTRRRLLTGVAAAAGAVALPAFAQAYPNKPVRWIVPYAAGGGSDAVARIVCEGLGNALGQRFIVDNKPGAGGTVGAQQLAAAPADGYTMGTADNGTLYNNWHLFDKLQYKPESFEYVGMMGRFPLVLAVSSKVPVKNFSEWLEWAKRNPGNVNYGTPGVGSPHHIALADLEDRLGLRMQHIPYKGDSGVVVDLIGGQLQTMLTGVATARQYLKDDRIRFLAVIWNKRLSSMPDVPTFTEVGVPNFEESAEQGVLMPAGTPGDLILKINQEVGKILNTAAVQEKLETMGMYPMLMSPDNFKAHVHKRAQSAGELIKRKHIVIS